MVRPKYRIADWGKIERQFRAGLLTIREIALEAGVAEGTIRYQANKRGWKRDLTQEVRTRSRTKMMENLAIIYKEGEEALKSLQDEQIVEEAARTQVQVVRQHQGMLKHGHDLTLRMLSELEAITCYHGELQRLIMATIAPARQVAAKRAISLGERTSMMMKLAAAARHWVMLERQAFGIVDERDKSEHVINDEGKTAEQLRQEILEGAKEIGLSLDADDGLGRAGNGKTH